MFCGSLWLTLTTFGACSLLRGGMRSMSSVIGLLLISSHLAYTAFLGKNCSSSIFQMLLMCICFCFLVNFHMIQALIALSVLFLFRRYLIKL